MSEDKLNIVEIFLSLQGEGLHIGEISNFVRLTGCTLNCSYCDTGNRNIINEQLSIDDIIRRCDMRFPVCVTGGEPLEQGDLAVSLIDELLKYTSVVLETNGAHLVPSRWMGDDNMCLSVDCKGPSSGVKECDMLFPYESLTKKDQMKFVIANHEDMLFLEKKLQEIFHIETNIIVTPAGGISESLAADILDACNKKKTHGAFYNCASTIKILPQMHKIWRVK